LDNGKGPNKKNKSNANMFLFSIANLPQRSILSQPHFWKSVRMTLTLPKWGLGSPPRLPKVESWITRIKKPCIGVFFISLESYESVDVENELAWAIWTSAAQVIWKRRAGNQTGNLTPDH
jgi:hypothetical protein